MALINIHETGNASNQTEVEFYIEDPEILDAYFAVKNEEKAYETNYEMYKVKNNTETLSMLSARYKSALKGKALEEEIVLVNSLRPNSDGKYVLLQERQLAIPVKKEIGLEVQFERISQIPMNKEVYLIIETNNFRKKIIQAYVLEGDETTKMMRGKQPIQVINSQGQTAQYVETSVGEWSSLTNVINKSDFKDWGICTLQLSSNYFNNTKKIHLLVDAFSKNAYFNRADNRMEKLDYRGKSQIKFGIKNLWFGTRENPFELIQP